VDSWRDPAIFGALSFAELGAAHSRSGGDNAYLRRAFVRVRFFLGGCIPSWQAQLAGIHFGGHDALCQLSIPAVATPIFTVHIPAVGAWIAPYDFCFYWAQPLAVLWPGGHDGRELFGRAVGRRGAGFSDGYKNHVSHHCYRRGVFLAHGAPHAPDPFWPAASERCRGYIRSILATLAAALWAMTVGRFKSGGSEVADHSAIFQDAGRRRLFRRDYLIYCSAPLALKVLPFDSVAGSQHIASDVVEHVIGRGAAAWITVAMAISALGSMNSSVLSGARVPYAMSRMGFF